MELCIEHAREVHNRSVDRIAEVIGLTNKWALYKWVESGKMPTNMIPAFELACGIDFVSRWLAHTNNKLLINIPTGRNLSPATVSEFHQQFSDSFGLLARFYEGSADKDETLFSLTTLMEQAAWHRANVDKHDQPELDFED